MPDLPDLFRSGPPETPWEWARNRRVHFPKPGVDILAGVVAAVVFGGVTYLIDPNDAIKASLIGLFGGVGTALALAYGETVWFRLRRNAILLEESLTRERALRIDLATYQEKDDTSEQQLRRALGDLQLSYVYLEREFTTANGDTSLWNKQTTLHNAAFAIIDKQLGRDFYSQFKDAKEKPLVVPSSFPAGDDERLNLLYMIHGRAAWLGRTIDYVRQRR